MSDTEKINRGNRFLEDARRALAAGDDERARNVLEGALEYLADPQSTEMRHVYGQALLELGNVHARRGNRGAALMSFERALQTDGSIKEAALRLVEFKIDTPEAGEPDLTPHLVDYATLGHDGAVKTKALRKLQGLLRIQLTDAPASLESRMKFLRLLVSDGPPANFPKLYLGRGCYLLQDYRGAINYLRGLKGGSADTFQVLNVLGRCHERLGELEAARAVYQKSLKISPDQAGIHFRLGRIELKLAELT